MTLGMFILIIILTITIGPLIFGFIYYKVFKIDYYDIWETWLEGMGIMVICFFIIGFTIAIVYFWNYTLVRG